MDKKEDDIVQGTEGFPSIPRAYINTARISYGLFDFQLVLATQVLDNLRDEVVALINPVFVAQMSPQHFKVFAHVVNEQLGKYESAFGVIQLPKQEPDKGKPS